MRMSLPVDGPSNAKASWWSRAGGRRVRALRRLYRRSDWIIRASFVLALLIFLLAVLTPWIAPFDPDAQSLLARLRPPVGFDEADTARPLGTDQLGRDMLSRCLYGVRLTLGIAAIGVVIGLVVGTTLGLVSGFFGGVVDDLVMGVVDVQIAVPFTLIALLAVAVFGTSMTVLVAVLGAYGWEKYARLIRGQVLAVRNLPYVEAARAAGASTRRTVLVHILPNIASPVIVMMTLTFSEIILLESSLSFLGLGVQPPTATLGSMVGQGRDYMASSPWIVASPALLIMFVALVVLLLGGWLRDVLDVKLRNN